MPLDPHLAGMLQMMASAGAKPIHESTPAEARAGFLMLTAGSRTPAVMSPPTARASSPGSALRMRATAPRR